MKHLWVDNHFGDKWYHRIKRRHTPLWNFVSFFIKEFKVKSLFEVGGGPAPLQKLVETYTNIEVNEKYATENTPKCRQIIADFSTYDISKETSPDLFLGMGVIEHFENYESFLKKAIELKPKFIIVSFFNGLNKSDSDRIRVREENKKHEKINKYWINHYSEKCLLAFLKEEGVLKKSCIISLPCKNNRTNGESVLIINLCNEQNFDKTINDILMETGRMGGKSG
jgi:hypothetical protein